MILKTYSRVLTPNMDAALAVLGELVGAEPDLRVRFRRFDIAFTGGFCVLSGPQEAMDRYRGTVGPVIVDDLDETRETVLRHGAELTMPPFEGPAGMVFLARHPDNVEYEYLQFTPELGEAVLGGEHTP
ncbi:VOC family protein [Streptomyces sp. NRRL B-1677]|uniref:VOC family protein n=1 Tax=Streptomyces sp. NRRL B-1677 TaxID=2682966 RepID=UPI0018928D8B|nr:VOC family protein [Streptomyces sp. NRRL B-1677]MBF6049180.1 VOC family protein [Streptomyces sp. NRRL B-1677]